MAQPTLRPSTRGREKSAADAKYYQNLILNAQRERQQGINRPVTSAELDERSFANLRAGTADLADSTRLGIQAKPPTATAQESIFDIGQKQAEADSLEASHERRGTPQFSIIDAGRIADAAELPANAWEMRDNDIFQKSEKTETLDDKDDTELFNIGTPEALALVERRLSDKAKIREKTKVAPKEDPRTVSVAREQFGKKISTAQDRLAKTNIPAGEGVDIQSMIPKEGEEISSGAMIGLLALISGADKDRIAAVDPKSTEGKALLKTVEAYRDSLKSADLADKWGYTDNFDAFIQAIPDMTNLADQYLAQRRANGKDAADKWLFNTTGGAWDSNTLKALHVDLENAKGTAQ